MRTIGPYTVVEPIGKGGRGVVFRARNRATGKEVALKTIPMPEGRLLQGIRREIFVLAGLRHPGIVRLLDHGIDDGLPWYAMELVEGASLLEYCAEFWDTRAVLPGRGADRPVVPTDAVRNILDVMSRLCKILAFIHGRGIVHRDLKPGNVLVRKGGMPLVMDFEFVCRFGGKVSREALDVGGRSVGTPSYMAPEQIRGEYVDARSDLYAFGCILYEVFTGAPPFRGSSNIEILQKHIEETPEKPSAVVAGLPPDLEVLILHLLEKDPRKRLGYADVAASLLTRLSGGREPTEARLPAYLYRPRFTGREQAMRDLTRRLTDLDNGRGGFGLIEGEAGMGKTRLAMEIAQEAANRSFFVLCGESLGTGALTLQALRKPLQWIADHCKEKGEKETHVVLGPGIRVLAAYEPSLADVPGYDAYWELEELPVDEARTRLFTFLLDSLKAISLEEPVVLILDDLQWADLLTLGFLEFVLAEDTSKSPVLVLGTYRKEEAPGALGRITASPKAFRIELPRLSENEVALMVADMLALGEEASGLSRFLTRHGEGNPFFVCEYLRAAVEGGVLYRDGSGVWQVSGPAVWSGREEDYEGLELPRSLMDLVDRRLQGLPDNALVVMEAASVLGNEFRTPLLSDVTLLPEDVLMQGVDVLVKRQILVDEGGVNFRFSHKVIEELAYRGIAAASLKVLHARAAAGIERLVSSGRGALSPMVGRHWERAGDPDRARRAYLAEARFARDRFADDEAERLYRACLRIGPDSGGAGAEARCELADLLEARGKTSEAYEQLNRTLADARAALDRKSEGQTLQKMATLRLGLGSAGETRELFEEALRLHRSVGDREAEGGTLDGLAILQAGQGKPDEARAILSQSLAVHRELGDDRNAGILVSMQAELKQLEGRSDEAVGLYSQALERLHREGNRQWAAVVLDRLGMIYHAEGLVVKARECLERAVALNRELRNRRLEEQAAAHLARLVRQTAETPAEWDGAVRRLESLLLEPDDGEVRVVTLCELGHAALAGGRGARAFLDRAHSMAGALKVDPGSRAGKAVEGLIGAIEEAERGGAGLYRGERSEALPPGVRKYLNEAERTKGGTQ